MKRLRVLHLLDTANWAGTERHVLTLAEQQRASGCVEPTLWCLPGTPLWQRAEAAGLSLLPAGRPGGSRVPPTAYLRLKTFKQKFDLFHAHNGRCAAAAVAFGRRVVATQHFVRPATTLRGGWRGRCSRWLNRRVTQRVGRWIAVSDAARRAMTARGDAGEGVVLTVPNGVSHEAPASPRSSVRGSLGITPEQKLVLCVSRLADEKGLDVLIEAAGLLSPDARVVVAGGGRLREQLEGLARDRRAPVTFLGMREDIADLLVAADVFVSPAPEEPFGLAIVEAMAAGRPVVAMAAGGPLEIVADGESGVLVEPGNSSALASAIGELLADADRRVAYGQAGLRRYEELFTAERMAAKTYEVYRSLMNDTAV